MTRIAAFALVLVTSLLVTSVILPGLAVAGWRPDVVALTVVAFALVEGPETGTRYGFAAGLASDLLGGADQLVGVSALVLLLLGYAAGQARPYLSLSTLAGIVVAGAVAGGAAAAGRGALLLLLDPASLPLGTLAESIVVTTLYSAVVAPFVLRPVVGLLRRTRSAVADAGGRA